MNCDTEGEVQNDHDEVSGFSYACASCHPNGDD